MRFSEIYVKQKLHPQVQEYTGTVPEDEPEEPNEDVLTEVKYDDIKDRYALVSSLKDGVGNRIKGYVLVNLKVRWQRGYLQLKHTKRLEYQPDFIKIYREELDAGEYTYHLFQIENGRKRWLKPLIKP